MSPDEWRDFKKWYKHHENFVVWTLFCGVVTIITSMLIGGCPAGSHAKDQWNWDWFQFILVFGIGSLITFAPLITVGTNRLIYRGRHRVGITREAKRDRAARQRLAAEKQAHDLQQAEARVLELEVYCGIEPLTKTYSG